MTYVNQKSVRLADLFSGCGGFSLGAEQTGLPPAVAFDIDPILTSSYEANHPLTKLVLADLSNVTPTDVERAAGGHIDGVFGGPPCQAFSSIGHRKADDPRRSLLGHFFRLIAGLKPAFFVMENVRGLAYADARPVLDEALGMLPGLYRTIGPIILDAADFGAATRRSRLFVIGYDPDRMAPLTEDDIKAKHLKPSTVGVAMRDLKYAKSVGEHEGFDMWKLIGRGRPTEYARALRNADGTFTGHRRTFHRSETVTRFAAVKPGKTDEVGRHPRLDWNGQCPTLRAGTGNDRGSFQSVRPIHPDEARVITVREAARLQGFPDDFLFHPTIWHSFRMIGNSVSPFVAKAIFSLIAERTGFAGAYKEAAE